MDLREFESLSDTLEVHNALRKKLCIDYLPRSEQRAYQIFRANCRLHLSIAEQSLNDTASIFDVLESKGKVGIGEYSTLRRVVSDADCRILDLIEAAERRIKQLQEQEVPVRPDAVTNNFDSIPKETGSQWTMVAVTVVGVGVLVMLVTVTTTTIDSNHDNKESVIQEVTESCSATNGEVCIKDDIGTKISPDIPEDNIYSENSNRDYVYIDNELRILLVGKTGVGKSTAGNRILGKDEFETDTSDESVTSKTTLGQADSYGRKLMVVDTPGLFDTERSNEETISEIMKCYGLTAPGLHAILLVHDVGRMTDEQIDTINIFQDRFGENLERFLILVFTGKDKLTNSGKTIDQYVADLKPNSNLKKMLNRTQNRYVALSLMGSKEELNQEIDDLIAMIERVVKENGGRYYTNHMYRQAEKVLLDRLAEVKRREKEKRDKEIQDAVDPLIAEHAQKERDLQEQIQQKDKELEKRKKEENFLDKTKKEWERFKRRGYKIAW